MPTTATRRWRNGIGSDTNLSYAAHGRSATLAAVQNNGNHE